MIRKATTKDLLAIGKVHSICFPDSYITQLGKVCGQNDNNLLSRFYYEFMTDAPELFVVADDEENGIVGFCMGYYMDRDNQISNFIRRNRIHIAFKTALLLLCLNRQTWKKIADRLKHKPNVNDWTIVSDKYEHIGNDLRGDLLSVCVLPEFRGKGYSQKLMEVYLDSMKNNGRKICLLSVLSENKAAINYYKRNGFFLYRTRGSIGHTYMKLL